MGFKFINLNKFDTSADEKRLEDLAAEGEFIKWNAGFLAWFKKSEPRKLKYCLEIAMFRPNRKRRELYRESGWEYVGSGNSVSIYSSENENAVPLHTDRAEYAHLVKKYRNAANASVIICYIIIALLIFLPVIFFPMTTGGKVNVLVSLPLMGWFLMTYLRTFPVFIAEMVIVFIEFLNSAKAGKYIAGCIENKKDAEKAVRANNILTGIYVFLWVLYAAAAIFLGVCINANTENDVPFTDIPSQAITIDEVYGTENIQFINTDEAAEKYLDPEIFDGKIQAYGANATEVKSIVTDKAYYYGQHAAYVPNGAEKGNKVYVSGSYSEFRNSRLAEKCSEEIMEYEAFFFSSGYDSEITVLDTEGTAFDTANCLVGKNKVLLSLTKDNELYTVRVSRLEENNLTPEKVVEDILNGHR
ncbi:MAG: DUF2812 domain-containing protein [Oscillospiraceae bacterium]|nr:DUF2812 domain-containing protein [Oscillospiraceae bacterium]